MNFLMVYDFTQFWLDGRPGNEYFWISHKISGLLTPLTPLGVHPQLLKNTVWNRYERFLLLCNQTSPRFWVQTGGGQKWQNSVHVVVEWPLVEFKLFQCTSVIIFVKIGMYILTYNSFWKVAFWIIAWKGISFWFGHMYVK